MDFKVMTYNIQHGLNYKLLLEKQRIIELDRICEIIQNYNPDVIGLNEVYNDINNIETVEQVKYIANKLGYKYYYFDHIITIKNNIQYGNGIISKYPLVNIITHKIPDPVIKDEDVYYESRSIIDCDVLIENKIIKVFVTHVGLAKSEQTNAINELIKLMNKKQATILLGDFNMEEDNYNIKLLSKYITNTSYLIKDDFKGTYPSINPRIKIDYIFTNNLDVNESEIIKEVSSDHFPVFINININLS